MRVESPHRAAVRRSTWSCHGLFVALASLFLAPAIARAQGTPANDPQGFELTRWTIANGLPQGTINDILQTSEGELWIATFGGLLRFDGLTFQTYDLDSLAKLPSIRVTALANDGADGLWVATQVGDILHVRDGVVTESHQMPNPATNIVEIERDRHGSLWVRATSGALNRLHDGEWTKILESGSSGTYENLAVDTHDRVWVGASTSILRFDLDGRQIDQLDAPNVVESIATENDGTAWVGFKDGFGRVVGNEILRIPTDPPFTGLVNAIQSDGNGGVWLGTASGPRHARPGNAGEPWRVYAPPFGFPANYNVRAILTDREHNVWVGAYGQGLARMTPHRVQRVAASKPDWMVTSVGRDPQGKVWVGGDCLGLLEVSGDPLRATPIDLPVYPPKTSCVNALAFDARGRLWVSLGHMVIRRDDDRWTTVLDSDGVADSYRPIFSGRDGNVWIGGLNNELHCFGPDDRELPMQTLPQRIVSIGDAVDGSLWIGASSAIYHLVQGRLETIDERQGLPRGDVRDILADPDGDVWIATYGGGLARISDGKVQRIAREQGLPDNSLSRILDDELGHLWVLSNRGLIVVERRELRSFLQGRIPRIEPVLLGPESGMPEANFGSPAGCRDGQGRLWFGTLACAVRVDPKEFPFNRTRPRVHVERVLADEQDVPLHPSVTIPPGTRRTTIEYTTYCLTDPDSVRFRYQLEGFDEHWVDGESRRRVSFTSLAPGAYTFHLDARNENGVWSDAPLAFGFVVQPTWWQTSLFRFAALIAGLGLLWGLDRIRVGVIRRRAQVLLEATRGRAQAEERESRLREELAHVARVATAGELATSLAHEVNQPLAAIVANAHAGRRFLQNGEFEREEMNTILEEIAQQGQRASEVIRRLREFLRKHGEERRPLDLNSVVRDTLPLLRRELADHGVHLVLELSDRLPLVTVDPIQVQQVLVNLIKNACEAMSGTKGERKLVLRTESDDESVRLIVRDSGPGLAAEVRERLFQPYVTTKPAGMGLGLAICRTIVEAHGGRLGVVPHDGPGVSFRIELPVPGGRGDQGATTREQGRADGRFSSGAGGTIS